MLTSWGKIVTEVKMMLIYPFFTFSNPLTAIASQSAVEWFWHTWGIKRSDAQENGFLVAWAEFVTGRYFTEEVDICTVTA